MVAIQLAGRAGEKDTDHKEGRQNKRAADIARGYAGLYKIACYAVCDRSLIMQKRLSKTIAIFFSEQNESKYKLMEKRER